MLNNIIPYPIFGCLWGNRKRYGALPNENDPDWELWQKKAYTDFYQKTQQKGIGNWVCNLAFPVVAKIDFSGKTVLEFGPGIIRHINFLNKNPVKYILCDVNTELLRNARKQFKEAGFPCDAILIDSKKGLKLPFGRESIDIIISFNTLEHLYPLDSYLAEMKRLLKIDGSIVGGVPCEGGLAWGLGRFITSRRYVNKNYGINYDKIICWEHPNFADFIIRRLDFYFKREFLKFHPFPLLPLDLNLTASFIYGKN